MSSENITEGANGMNEKTNEKIFMKSMYTVKLIA